MASFGHAAFACLRFRRAQNGGEVEARHAFRSGLAGFSYDLVILFFAPQILSS